MNKHNFVFALIAIIIIAGCTAKSATESKYSPTTTTGYSNYPQSQPTYPSYQPTITFPPTTICRLVEENYQENVSYIDTETYYETENYDVKKETLWALNWYSITGDKKFGGLLGNSTLPPTFIKDWGSGVVYGTYSDYVGFLATSEINVPIGGIVHFEIGGDDGTSLYVDNSKIIDNSGEHFFNTKAVDFTLTKGKHTLVMDYSEITGQAKVSFKTDDKVTSWTETLQRTVPKTREITKWRMEPRVRTKTVCQ